MTPQQKAILFANLRDAPFGKNLTQQNVDGTEAIVDYWESKYGGNKTDYALATILANAFHETDGTMRWDIEEYGKGKGHQYGITQPNGYAYYGRGFPQLTWASNYKTLGTILGIDLYGNPKLALVKENSAAIIVEGMMRHLFGGKSVADYYNGAEHFSAEQLHTAMVESRHTVNGTDKAELISGYISSFYKAIFAARHAESTPVVEVKKDAVDQPPVTTPPATVAEVVDSGDGLSKSKIVWGAVGSSAPTLVTAVFCISNKYALGAFVVFALCCVGVVVFFRKQISYKFGV